jgi:hypothetical protein
LSLCKEIALSKAKAITLLKFSQQQNGDRTFNSQNDRILNFEFMSGDRTLKSQSDCNFKV